MAKTITTTENIGASAPSTTTETAATDATTAPPAESPILQQGEVPEPIVTPVTADLAGTYRVLHGSVNFGAGVVAYPGAIVKLDATAASLLLPHGIVERA